MNWLTDFSYNFFEILMSHEWQGPLRPGEKPNIPQAENPAAEKPREAEDETTVEKELSPEVIGMIMEKVQDIDKKGISFTKIGAAFGSEIFSLREIKYILKYGLISSFASAFYSVRDITDFIQSSRINYGPKHYIDLYAKLIGKTPNELISQGIYQKIIKEEERIESYIYGDKKYSSGKTIEDIVEEANNNAKNILGEKIIKDLTEKATGVKNFFDIIVKNKMNEKFTKAMKKNSPISALLELFPEEDLERIFQKVLYPEFLKLKGRGRINFNIVGRIKDNEYVQKYFKEKDINALDIERSYWVFKVKKAVIIFFENNFNEINKITNDTGTYYCDERGWEKNGKCDSEFGFNLNKSRLASNIFKGLILKNFNTEELNFIKEIEREIYKYKEKLLLPIYDIKGNLLWPKQMSYEEVKKFVAEREAKKTQNENLKD